MGLDEIRLPSIDRMGLHDRHYYRNDERLRYDWGGSTRSAVATLIIINVAIFVIDAFTTGGGGWLMDKLTLYPDLFQRPWNFWQLLTHGFGHAPLKPPPPLPGGPEQSSGIWHLFFNMFGLFIFGVPVEQKYGKAEFIRFYLFAIIFSGFIWVVVQSMSGAMHPVIGASGAVTAVVVLMALNFPYREMLLLGVVPIQMWILATMYVVYDFISSFSSDSRVAYVAHLGGAAFAALYFFLNWNFSRLEQLKKWFPFGRPQLRVHKPKEDRLQDEADRVLEKIHRNGESSLTRGERKTLERYSKQMRERRKPDS